MKQAMESTPEVAWHNASTQYLIDSSMNVI